MKFLAGILAMAAIVVASNILVQFLILDGLLTWGAFTYPLAFLVTDLMNRVYGAGPARRVVLAGFVTGIACSLVGTQVMLPADGDAYAAVAWRVAVGSATAFLVAQLVDVAIFRGSGRGPGGAHRSSRRWSARRSTPRCSSPSPLPALSLSARLPTDKSFGPRDLRRS